MCPISCMEHPLHMTLVSICLSMFAYVIGFFSTDSVDAAADGRLVTHKSDRCMSHHRH